MAARTPNPDEGKKRLNVWVSIACYSRIVELAETLSGPDRKVQMGRALEDMCRREEEWEERGDKAALILAAAHLPSDLKVETAKVLLSKSCKFAGDCGRRQSPEKLP